ncbi:MAG: Hsp70 family protein [Eubacterium sp.]
MAVIGIDLGTTNSLACIWKDGKAQLIPNSFGEYMTPSVVGVDDDKNIIVGKTAKERLISHPDKTVSSFKCFMGTDKKISLGDKEYRAEELSSLVLRKIKEDAEYYLGESVEEAVISVPAYFNDNGRSATKLAGELAGFKVERIINEPSAAALAYGIDTAEDNTYLVFDFGGGTLDISIVDIFDGVIEIIAVAGDNHLGGDDFNLAVAKYFCAENGLDFDLIPAEQRAIILKQAELCKITLSSSSKAGMVASINGADYSLVLDSNMLLKATASIFDRIKAPMSKALTDASMTADDISDVILVGGSSHMPLVQKYLESLFKREIRCTVSPDTAVAVGVGIVTGIKSRDDDIKDIVLTDICPFTLGINNYNDADPYRPIFFPLIERNTTLPASVEHDFYTSVNNQRKINISVAQGEKYYFAGNLKLGEITVDVPPAPAEKEGVTVRLTYDINGILQIDVTRIGTNKTKSKTIISNKQLSEDEISRRLAELEKLKIHPRESDEVIYLVARAERLFEESKADTRDIIRERLQYFNSVVESQDLRKIRIACENFKKFLDIADYAGGDPFADEGDLYD